MRTENMKWIENSLRRFCIENGVDFNDFLRNHMITAFRSERDLIYNAKRQALILAQNHRKRYLLLCICELRDACCERGIKHVFLKGLALGEELYEPAGARLSYDIDILVSIDDAPSLVSALQNRGFIFESDSSTGDPMDRVHNSHHHLRAMSKVYTIDGASVNVPVEIHVYPFARGYEFMGKTQTDLSYTEQVLSRCRIASIGDESFQIPSVTDGLLILIIHMLAHLTLDLILYLFVKKPYHEQYVCNQMIDAALYLKTFGESINRRELLRFAEETDHIHEIKYAHELFWEIFHLRLLDVHQHEDHVISTPFSIVCRLLGRIEPAEYILKGNLKKRFDEAIENNLFPRIVNTSDEISEIRIGSGMLRVSANSSPNRYSIDVLTHCDDMGISVDQYILDIEGKNAALYRGNGFRVVWDPSTYGQLHEKDLKYCSNFLQCHLGAIIIF